MADGTDPGTTRAPAVGGELLLPALGIALAIYFLIDVRDLAWEARANATVIASILLALIAIHLTRIALRVVRGQASLEVGPLIEPRPLLPTRFLILALTGIFIVALPWLGLTLGLFLLVVVMMRVLRAGSWTKIVVTAAIVSTLAYLLFIALLNSRLPHGPIEKLLAALL